MFPNFFGIKTPQLILECMLCNGLLIVAEWVLLGEETYFLLTT